MKAETWYTLRGGERKGSRGKQYYDKMSFEVYEGEDAKNLALKPFMMNHVTKYEPAIFVDLVDDWKAIEAWNLKEEGGEGD